MDLFDHAMQESLSHEAPLADRMRPQTLDEIVGQDHIIGEGRLLRRAIQADRLFSSIILYGPPGTGKTTLARVISNLTKAHFENLSAVLAGVADLRRVIADAVERRRLYQRRTILFVDEVHRWNKSQQDALLPHVETGLLTLIGATTQNPSFDVIKALVSRSRIFEIKALAEDDVLQIMKKALSDPERGYGKRKVNFEPGALAHLARTAGGDARNALNALELAVETTLPDENGVTTLDVAKRLLDYGYHPPTIYFPLIVKEAMMIEPTENEKKETLDEFIEDMIKIAKEAEENPDIVKSAPNTTSIKRLDEVKAARKPVVKWSK